MFLSDDNDNVDLFQSVVILSLFPFLNLFNQMLDLLAPEYFERGPAAIEEATKDIYKWPVPMPGQTACVKFLKSKLQVIPILFLCCKLRPLVFGITFMRLFRSTCLRRIFLRLSRLSVFLPFPSLEGETASHCQRL